MTTRSLKIYATVMAIATSLTLGACSDILASNQPNETSQSTVEPTPWALVEMAERDFNGINAIPNSDNKAFYADADNCRVKIEVHDENKLILVLPNGKTMEEPTRHKVRQEPAFASCTEDPNKPKVTELPPVPDIPLIESEPLP